MVSLLSDLTGGASKAAASTQMAYDQQALSAQKKAAQDATLTMQPWVNTGRQANSQLSYLLGLSPSYLPDDISTFQQTPGYDNSQSTASAMQKYGVWKAQQDAAQASSPAGAYGSLVKPFTGADLQNDPGYQFGLTQGQTGVNNSMAAHGSLLSGAALKALDKYTTDYAGTKYNDAFNRDLSTKQNLYGMLTGQSGMGQSAANTSANIDTHYGDAASGLLNAQGASNAAGIIGQANTLQGLVGSAIYGGNPYSNSNNSSLLGTSSYGNGLMVPGQPGMSNGVTPTSIKWK